VTPPGEQGAIPTGAPGAHARLITALQALRNADGGWPYYRGKLSRLEPTCWALLGAGVPLASTPLTRWAGPDGLLVEPATGHVNYAFNGLAALAAGRQGTPEPLTRGIVNGLLGATGVTVAPVPAIALDATLQGWSWTPGTFTWVEPTAWCMLALKRWPGEASATRRRLDLGERVLRDRACREGGWNFGNSVIYGNALPAHVPPTAIGVLAMQDQRADPIVTAAVGHLERHALTEGSTTALALSALALLAVGRPAYAVVAALVARCAEADLTSNAAVLGMAACALGAAAHGALPAALALSTVAAA
jgi:hypothetical protein